MTFGGCTFTGMYHTFPHLASRRRVLVWLRGRVTPRRSLFEPRRVFSARIRPPSSPKRPSSGAYRALLRHFFETGWKTLTLCCNFGPAPARCEARFHLRALFQPASSDLAASLLCRGKRTLWLSVTKRQRRANYAPAG